ncbi:hypothetical protein [Corynebacterium heidelbergense]|uniref:Uncharacterized protein n=1 Tax=Corynebacterium heidelbergense TaxID=2055947 RepID=A0A364VE48_9CORY|nr:hypothetical protein [Corynebacterium heidelbergense]RAV34925.1 hypothetical protein CWC39_00885 [Corynebacterium heidelbergense]WCZ36064.1 hypothetical protein CHEID_02490 [Corynebacterium heidelbergense]
MAGGCWPGKLIADLPQIKQHSPEVEADLLRFYGVDYRDRWRGRLSIRRLLVLVRGLPDDSAYKSAVGGVFPISPETMVLMDLFHAVSGQRHWYRTAKADTDKRQRLAREREASRARVAKMRREAREHNARVLARRAAEANN